MPIIEASWGVKFGTLIQFAESRTRPNPIPMPNSATRIGRHIANTEPNVISRISTAASSPTASALPGGSNSAFSITGPPNSTCRFGPLACAPREIMCSASLLATSEERTLNWIGAKAIVPSRDTARAPWGEYGLVTDTTWGRVATCANSACIVRWTAGSVTPAGARNTIVAVSPDWLGKRSRRRSNARWESVPGSEKLAEYAPPAFAPRVEMATSATTQITTIHRRRR